MSYGSQVKTERYSMRDAQISQRQRNVLGGIVLWSEIIPKNSVQRAVIPIYHALMSLEPRNSQTFVG